MNSEPRYGLICVHLCIEKGLLDSAALSPILHSGPAPPRNRVDLFQSHRIRFYNSLGINEIPPAPAASGVCRCYPEAEVNTMPWKGYFSKPDTRKLTMPRAGEGSRAASGFAFAGDVVTGRLSVQDAFKREAIRVTRTLATGTGADPDNLDPILKFHLKIKYAPAAGQTPSRSVPAIDYKGLT